MAHMWGVIENRPNRWGHFCLPRPAHEMLSESITTRKGIKTEIFSAAQVGVAQGLNR